MMMVMMALASVLEPFGTFAEIHSKHPGAFQSLVPSPVVNPDSSLPVQSPVHVYRPWENTRDLAIFENPRKAWSFYYIRHSFGL